jgi:hypothetical protein
MVLCCVQTECQGFPASYSWRCDHSCGCWPLTYSKGNGLAMLVQILLSIPTPPRYLNVINSSGLNWNLQVVPNSHALLICLLCVYASPTEVTWLPRILVNTTSTPAPRICLLVLQVQSILGQLGVALAPSGPADPRRFLV